MKLDEYAKSYIGEPYSWGNWSECEWIVQETLKRFGLMPEEKRFKNRSSVINTFDPEHTWLVEGFREHGMAFTHREWDMEVIFTKKAAKPEVGGTCKLARSKMFADVDFLILAVNDDLVWIRQLGVPAEEDTGWIESVSEVTDVKPWRPV